MKLLIKLQNFKKIQDKSIQKQSQIYMIKKYVKNQYVSPEERQEIIDKLRLK